MDLAAFGAAAGLGVVCTFLRGSGDRGRTDDASAAEVFVVGSSNVDLIAYTERLPAVGETVTGQRFAQGFGGKGANQAVAAALLGAKVSMMSAVGDDSLGTQTIANYQQCGVDCSHVKVCEGESTGVAPISVCTETGDNRIIVIPGANNLVLPASVEAASAEIGRARVVVAQLEVPLAATQAALAAGRDGGALTIFNPAPAPDSLPEELYKLSDIFIANETEAARLTGVEVAEDSPAEEVAVAGEALLRRGCKVAVLTLGGRGALVCGSEHAGGFWRELVPTAAVGRVVDTTGAGDSFVGALAFVLSRTKATGSAALASRRALCEAVRRAGLVAALSVQRPGTQSSYPRAAEVHPDVTAPLPRQ